MAQKQSYWFTSKGLAAMALIGAASYFLFMEHRQHVFQYLPFLILLLCPLMHFFMHGDHGHSEQGHNEQGHNEQGKDSKTLDLDKSEYQKGYEAGLKDRSAEQDNR